MTERKLLCFDIESTGPNPATDRIIQLALMTDDGGEFMPDGFIHENFLVHPGRPIPAEATAVHGITDERVADYPRFEAYANRIHSIVKDCDLLGFNLTNFDVPILWEELYRCGIEWDLSNTRILDAGTLFKRREERTLTAAMKFYCNRDLKEAHNAVIDVMATWEVWNAQVARYGLQAADRETLERESNYEEKRIDLAGKIIVGKDGRPTFAFGKAKGVAVEDDPGYAAWMLRSDFSANTKMHLESILYGPKEAVEAVRSDGEPF